VTNTSHAPTTGVGQKKRWQPYHPNETRGQKPAKLRDNADHCNFKDEEFRLSWTSGPETLETLGQKPQETKHSKLHSLQNTTSAMSALQTRPIQNEEHQDQIAMKTAILAAKFRERFSGNKVPGHQPKEPKHNAEHWHLKEKQ